MGKLGKVLGAEVRQLVLLPMRPQELDRIELGGIARQLLNLNRALRRVDVISHNSAAVCRQPIPDHQQLALDLPAQLTQKLDHSGTIERARNEFEVEIPEAQSGDGGELMPVEVHLHDRRVSSWRPGPHPMRALGEASLVDEHYRLPSDGGVFFNAGQRLRFQYSIAASSRSSARPTGRWQ